MIDQANLTKEQKVARAQEAQRLLDHPLIKEAFANLRLNYFEAWANTPPAEVNDRDGIFHAARVLSDVEAHLRIVVTQGSVERAQIKRMLDAKAAK